MLIMGVCLHVWVAWNTNQNKEAFTVCRLLMQRNDLNCFFASAFLETPRLVWVSGSFHEFIPLCERSFHREHAAGCIFTLYGHTSLSVFVLMSLIAA